MEYYKGNRGNRSATLKARKFKVVRSHFKTRQVFMNVKCYSYILLTNRFNYSFLLCKLLITHDHIPPNYKRWPVDYENVSQTGLLQLCFVIPLSPKSHPIMPITAEKCPPHRATESEDSALGQYFHL